MSYPTKEERIEAVRQAIRTILNELNGGNRRDVSEAISDTVRKEHRTLQASWWSAILLAQCAYADAPFDLRNEQPVRFAKEVRELARKHGYDFGGFLYV